ncbi:RNA degradosome polyphosphate kinase [Pseudokineococcus sp. 1T1Z-3]|uniref:RNA degradosome polyphosphate kinase n=1 Tax=Pseudokineococcus sp. 1T1Z-3 TaxID=3132745 RepID=UPI00309F04F0
MTTSTAPGSAPTDTSGAPAPEHETPSPGRPAESPGGDHEGEETPEVAVAPGVTLDEGPTAALATETAAHLGEPTPLPVPGAAAGDDDPLPDDRFLDRELSWLAFNDRVLQLAEDDAVPLLERARFLAIFASNLDEFFMVRVAGLKRRIATGLAVTAASGLQPREVLSAISRRAHELMARHAAVYAEVLGPQLADAGIRVVGWADLEEDEQERLGDFFSRQVFPVLTPLAVDPAHPFPYISGLSLNLAVVARNPATGTEHFARVKVPPLLPRLVQVDDEDAVDVAPGSVRFLPLETLIATHLDQLFPGMRVVATSAFRVTRNEDLEVEEDDAENILQALEKELLRRRFGPPVRLEVAKDTDAHVRELLVRELGVRGSEVYELPAPLDLRCLNAVADLDRPELHYPKAVSRTHHLLTDGRETATPGDFFTAIRKHDILLHHPYDAFSTSVQEFVQQAAGDPDVLAIKQTLYRTSGDSPIVDALIDAADAGKQVVALVEIKARFDEQANISWARKLEESGVHVVYGIVGLKTHAKLCLVVRQEREGLRRYVHIGTGNYNPKTARLYEDMGLLTADETVGEDVTKLFNQLSGYAPRTTFSRLLVAPRSLRAGLVERVEREVEHHRAGRPASVAIKVNSMVDETIIDALYRASRAGVPVTVVVRGICALRPGIPGLSETIQVRSLLGRYLEHSRIFAFAAGGNPEVWIGSADMMHRNLDRRVEALVKVDDGAEVAELLEYIDLQADDATSSWHLGPDGAWTRHARDAEGRPLLDAQQHLLERRHSSAALT